MLRNSNFDVVVVGAGPAGITAAICLAKADFSVLVLVAYGCSSTPVAPAADAGVDAAPEEDAAPLCPAAPTPAPFVKGTTTLPMDGTLRVNHIQANIVRDYAKPTTVGFAATPHIQNSTAEGRQQLPKSTI